MSSQMLDPYPLWKATATLAVRPPLASDLNVEVCVIGAGIAGLTHRLSAVASRCERRGHRGA